MGFGISANCSHAHVHMDHICVYVSMNVYLQINPYIIHAVNKHITHSWLGLCKCVCVCAHVVLPCWRLQYCCEKACGEGEAWEPEENGRTCCLRPASKLLYPLAQVPRPRRQGFQRWVGLNGSEWETQIDKRCVYIGRGKKDWNLKPCYLFHALFKAEWEWPRTERWSISVLGKSFITLRIK